MAAEQLEQFSAVAIGGRGLLIGGEPGSGKSSLCLSLIDRGARLIGDDGVAISRRGNRLVASPPHPTKGMLEIRNVGIVTLPCISAPVALILRLDEDAPRYVEQAETVNLHGCDIPMLRFALLAEANAPRAEFAMRMHAIVDEY